MARTSNRRPQPYISCQAVTEGRAQGCRTADAGCRTPASVNAVVKRHAGNSGLANRIGLFLVDPGAQLVGTLVPDEFVDATFGLRYAAYLVFLGLEFSNLIVAARDARMVDDQFTGKSSVELGSMSRPNA